MEWLAAAIRSYKGHASVVQVQSFDDLPTEQLKRLFVEARSRDYQKLMHEAKRLFVEARSRDYQKLMHEAKRLLALPTARRSTARVNGIRRRFLEITDIDFFESPLRVRLENLLAHADSEKATPGKNRKQKSGEYLNRLWMTRPRPGIDRVSSGWLIRRFIDPKARFVFGTEPNLHPDAMPFDMFCTQGFGHRGEDCTFETLCKQFAVRDSKVKRIAQIIHDADLGDEKFGRVEGQGLDKVLNGWAKQDLPDDELLKRGMDLIEGLYESLG
jgi:hypothetical protein